MKHDCLPGGRCYRYRVPIAPRTPRGPGIAASLAVALLCAGCATPPGAAPADAVAPPATTATLQPSPATPVEEAWWRRTGDPILGALIERGLLADKGAECRLAALHAQDRAMAGKTVGATLKRLFAKDADVRGEAAREGAVSRLAARRVRLAEDIALAYVELRRLQQIHTLRANVLDQYRDNAQIADFRRQAGLVSAVDSALASSQDDTARAELGYVDGRLQEALAVLARLVGEEPAVLAGQVGVAVPLPGGLLDGPAAQADTGREAALAEALETANRTAKDARSAYREGAGGYATVYVAEAAVLSVQQALADARAQRAAATIRQWSARGQGWARADLNWPTAVSTAPAYASNGSETVPCD